MSQIKPTTRNGLGLGAPLGSLDPMPDTETSECHRLIDELSRLSAREHRIVREAGDYDVVAVIRELRDKCNNAGAGRAKYAEELQQVAEALGMPAAPGHSVIHRVKELIAEKEQLRLERNRACRERDASDTEIEWVKRICFGGELPCVKPNSEVFEIFAAIKKLKKERDKLREQLHRSGMV